jgi:hypothetical protein
LIAALPLCLATGGIQAQFDDNFDDDPFLSGDWISNSNWGGPTWVEEGSPPCADPNIFDPLLPCTVDESYDGYVLITDPVTNRGGNFFRAEPDSYDNFQLVVEVELRDGGAALGRPADGMVVTVVGGDAPPSRLGTLGGGMGAPCVGGSGAEPSDNMLPQLAWEFDNWSCNTGDSGVPGVTGDAGGFPDSLWHHVAFSYSPVGFACTDAIQPDVFVPLKTSEVPLHNKQPPPADPNRFRMTVYAQRCGADLTVACDLEAIDTGVNLGRVYTHVVPNFEPFEGFLGVVASTGGAWQNHILHRATLTTLPAGFCLQPAGEASRDITITNPNPDICGDYEPGTVANVALTLANIRPASDCCAAATSGRVVETPPAGWTISGVSHGGTVNAGVITWNLAAPNFANGTVLTYTATAPGTASGIASFAGNTNDGAGGVSVFTRGETGLNPDQPFDECGRIKCWNLLSALGQSGGANPTVDVMQLDYLSDGVTTELDFVFEPSAEVAPEFFGAAASTFVFSDPNGRAPNAAEGIASVTKYVSPTGFVDLNNGAYGGNPDNVMTYAQIYVHSETAQDVYIASDSDDSIQILLNEEEVWINSFARGNDAGCPSGLIPPNRDRLRDVTPAPFPLNAGENRLIVKTFEGGGDFNFEIRFENADGSERPVTEGLSLSHFPSNPTCRVPPATVTRAIDTGRQVNGVDVWSSSDTGPFDVSLTLSDIRPAGGICPAAGQVTITETVPAGWTPSNPSGGGTVNGRDVTWTLAATNGATLSYDVAPGGAFVTAGFAGVITEAGSLSRYPLRGERTVLYAPAPFDKGSPTTLVDTNFDADIGACPQDWTCNIGVSPFGPVVNVDGQLQLTCSDNGDGIPDPAPAPGGLDYAACGSAGTSVLWNETVDLTSNSFTAEFDLLMSHPGNAALANPPADTFTFVVLDADNPATSASPPTYVGTGGGGAGYATLNGFAVEFDLWDNDGTEPSGYNIAADAYTHVAVIQNGLVLPHTQTHLDVLGPDARPTFLGGAGWPEFIDRTGGGVPIHVEIEYNNGNLQVYLTAPDTLGPAAEIEPAYPRTKVIDSLVTFATVGGLPVPAGQEPVLRTAWLGFTAGTGGAIFKGAVDDVAITLFPGGGPVAGSFRRGDSDASGAVNLTDAIRILNVLFLGIGEILCLDSADSDDSGAVNLTDAIRVLNVLFLGIGEIPAPGLTNCGPDPTADDTGCASYPAGC